MEQKIERLRTSSDSDAQLTPGEKLLIWRKRLNWNQEQAASYFGVSRFTYQLAEYDKSKDFQYPSFKLTLKPWELCVLYRKRSGKTQRQLAGEIGISPDWFRQQESGKIPCLKLLDWWEDKTA